MSENADDPGSGRGRALSDPAVAETEQAHEKSRASALFDLRKIIGGLLALYGVILIIVGLLDGPKELAKAGGIHINLWTGIGMLIVGALFLTWSMLTDDGHDRAKPQAEAAEARR